jgi:hypothetical protein
MATIWDRDLRQSFVHRLERLAAAARPHWGKMSAAGMVAHLNDSARMALGELPVKSKGARLRFWPIKQLILYVLPFPRSAPTAPELMARCNQASLDEERKQFIELMARLGQVTETTRFGEHPAFGVMTHKEYGALIAKHTEHHFRQFGL